MAIFMRKKTGEKEILRIEASSFLGDGALYITSEAIAYEVYGKGIYLNFIPLKSIKKFNAVTSSLFGARKFRMVWLEDNTEHHFEFRTKKHTQLQNILSTNFT